MTIEIALAIGFGVAILAATVAIIAVVRLCGLTHQLSMSRKRDEFWRCASEFWKGRVECLKRELKELRGDKP